MIEYTAYYDASGHQDTRKDGIAVLSVVARVSRWLRFERAEPVNANETVGDRQLVSSLLGGRSVDPSGGGQLGRLGQAAHEALGMGGVGGCQDPSAVGLQRFGPPVMDGGRGHETKSRVTVPVVVPVEEGPAEAPGMQDGTEVVGEVGPVLKGLELGLGVRVVGGRVGPRVRLGDPEVGEQERHRLGPHRNAGRATRAWCRRGGRADFCAP